MYDWAFVCFTRVSRVDVWKRTRVSHLVIVFCMA
jgi:hypothetical protein